MSDDRQDSCCTRLTAWMRFDVHSPRSVDESPIMSRYALAWFRAVIVCICVPVTVLSFYNSSESFNHPFGRYRYLTVWTFDFITIYMAAASHLGFRAWRSDGRAPISWTLARRLTMVVGEMAFSLSIVVALMYWILLAPDADITELRNQITNPISHGFNAVFMLVDAFVSSRTFEIRHIWTLSLSAVIYTGFNAAYTLGADSIIYGVLSWDSAATAVYVIITVLAAHLFFFFGMLCVNMRNRCFPKRPVAALSESVDEEDGSGAVQIQPAERTSAAEEEKST